MPDGDYAKKVQEWDATTKGKEPTLLQTLFGSCSGVMDAASVMFQSSESCHVVTRCSKANGSRRKSRRSKSPSLKKSEEVIEIPEFLNADLLERRDEGVPTDDISALSSYTLDEMAKQKLIADKSSVSRKNRGAGPPSPTLTDISDDHDLPAPGYNYIRRHDIDKATPETISKYLLTGNIHGQ